MPLISGSMLYDIVQCPHRVTMDVFGDRSLRDPANEFLSLLWEQGAYHEKDVVDAMDPRPTDLSALTGREKEEATWEALQRGDELIYGGRLTHGDLVGEPDLLRRSPQGLVPGDIKSGSAEESESGKPKKHYAMQLAHYVNMLEQLKLSDGTRLAFVIDRTRNEVTYDLSSQQGVRNARTWWEEYLQQLAIVRALISHESASRAAAVADCKQCDWRSECMRQICEADDLSLIPELGRSKRDVMIANVRTVAELAAMDIGAFINGKKTVFAGIGPDTLAKFKTRAMLLKTPGAAPYLRRPFPLDLTVRHLLFDVEVDPIRDVCYLHGFVDVDPARGTTEYVAMFADDCDPESERLAFEQALSYVRSFPDGTRIVHYSKYERTTWRALQAKFQGLATEEEIESYFAVPRALDLYTDVVKSQSEWPTNDHSIKTLAKYLGFSWRDADPSGASSIGWYHEWTASKDPSVKRRILDYNEDDCLAMKVLCEGLARFPVKPN